jgi:hypothetical protein
MIDRGRATTHNYAQEDYTIAIDISESMKADIPAE